MRKSCFFKFKTKKIKKLQDENIAWENPRFYKIRDYVRACLDHVQHISETLNFDCTTQSGTIPPV